MAAETSAVNPLSRVGLFASDAKLQSISHLQKVYGVAASDAVLATTKAALEAKGHAVKIAATKEEVCLFVRILHVIIFQLCLCSSCFVCFVDWL